jgi:5'-methylthioadenosine/S-adenosylhomocysteine nucleosidase
MRPIAIMAAMQEEMVGLTSALQAARTIHNGSRQFTTGTWHGQAVVLVLSRIGKVAAATTATALIERFNVSAIVFTGVAGGLASGVNVGDIIIEGENLYGEGVNIAARLEGIAAPGGISISDKVYAEVRRKFNFVFEDKIYFYKHLLGHLLYPKLH